MERVCEFVQWSRWLHREIGCHRHCDSAILVMSHPVTWQLGGSARQALQKQGILLREVSRAGIYTGATQPTFENCHENLARSMARAEGQRTEIFASTASLVKSSGDLTSTTLLTSDLQRGNRGLKVSTRVVRCWGGMISPYSGNSRTHLHAALAAHSRSW